MGVFALFGRSRNVTAEERLSVKTQPMANRHPESAQPQSGGSEMASVVERNIQGLLVRRKREERKLGWQERLADSITTFTGSMRFVYLHVVIYFLWITINLGWIPGVPRFDPTFVVLAMEASVEAIFLSTFILITQNRMSAEASKKADLDLQVTLLAEHEITRLVAMVQEIGNRLGIESAKAPELEELTHDVAPEKVLDTMEKHEQAVRADGQDPRPR
jgi:uncharacterized membrane protein